MTNEQNLSNGCELCGDWPVSLRARCHPTAPLRVEMPDDTTMVFYCYLPECNREVTRVKVSMPEITENK